MRDIGQIGSTSDVLEIQRDPYIFVLDNILGDRMELASKWPLNAEVMINGGRFVLVSNVR